MIRDGDWKLITGPESGGFTKFDRQELKSLPAVQLYNLKDYIGETKNLAAENPEKVVELTRLLDRIRKNVP